jgi:hypothetical protein
MYEEVHKTLKQVPCSDTEDPAFYGNHSSLNFSQQPRVVLREM